MGGGYRDLNINIEFEGLVCEVQIHVREFFELKAGAHPCYERCRYLGLVGELPETETSHAGVGLVKVSDTKMPMGIRITLVLVRWFVGSFSAGFAAAFPPSLLYYGLILPNERELWFKIILSIACVTVPSIISFLTTRAMLRGLSCAQGFVAVTLGTAFWIIFGYFSGGELTLVLSAFGCTYLLHAAAAVASLRWNSRKKHSRNRVAMLYDLYLGIDGRFFVWKVIAMQSFTIVLQAPAKLPVFGGLVWLSGAPGPPVFAASLKPLFWLFVIALFVNAIYPSILLRSKNMVLQRDACAAVDAVLDLLYFTTFQLATYFSGSLAYNIPVSTYAYMSCFWPLLHIYTVAQALEAAALRRHEEINALAKRRGPRKPTRRLTLDALKETAQLVLKEDARVANSRLPSWAAILYVLGTLGFIGMVFITQCGRDRYPFGNWNGPCRPCVCDSAGLLLSCAVPAEVKAVGLYFLKQQFTDCQSIK